MNDKRMSLIMGIILGGLLAVIAIDWFFDTWTFVNPISIRLRSPIQRRVILEPIVEPKIKTKPVKGTPTPSPTKKRVKNDSVGAGGGSNITVGPRSYIEDKIQAVFGKDAKIALAIAKAESGLRYNAVSSTNDHGIFQVNATYHAWRFKGKSMYDVDSNIEVAKQIFDEQGSFNAWSAYKNKAYLSFMK